MEKLLNYTKELTFLFITGKITARAFVFHRAFKPYINWFIRIYHISHVTLNYTQR